MVYSICSKDVRPDPIDPPMSPAVRATTRRHSARVPNAPAVYRTVGPAGKRRSKPRQGGEISLATPGLDMSTRLRVFQRALRSRVEHHGALLDMVRAVNSTLDPAKLADLVVERAATWLPAPCWAIVRSDASGQLSVLAARGLMPEMGPAVYAVARWVMERSGEFAAADLRRDRRVTDPSVGTVLAFPLTSRGRRIGALIGLDRAPS